MQPYFQSPERVLQIVCEARSWIGTPFQPHGRSKRAGVDCVNLVAQCYIATGFIQSFTPPPYRMNGGEYLAASAVEQFIQALGIFAQVDPRDPQPGDCVALRWGRISHHVGIVTRPPLFVHTYRGVNAFEAGLDDPTIKNRVTALYRPVCISAF